MSDKHQPVERLAEAVIGGDRRALARAITLIESLRAAAAKLGVSRLTDCDLYVTLEPCPMCATAASFFRIRRLYFAAPAPKGGGVEHGPRIFNQPSCHHKPEVYGGIRESEAGELLKTFFRDKR